MSAAVRGTGDPQPRSSDVLSIGSACMKHEMEDRRQYEASQDHSRWVSTMNVDHPYACFLIFATTAQGCPIWLERLAPLRRSILALGDKS